MKKRELKIFLEKQNSLVLGHNSISAGRYNFICVRPGNHPGEKYLMKNQVVKSVASVFVGQLLCTVVL